MKIKYNKFFLILLGATFLLPIFGEVKKEESIEDLKVKSEKLKREILYLEDKAAEIQFKRRMVGETQNIYERINHLQLELNEINDKIEKAQVSEKQ